MERNKLLVGEDSGWFTVWRVLFEVTSGYATVGASFGEPFSNLSFSGSFRKISKLIVSSVPSTTKIFTGSMIP